MKPTISIGTQSFEYLREHNYFFIDKTDFIKEWWENGDAVTLITRPRRFGKTLNLDMFKCFFSNQYSKREDLFHGLSIWKDDKYRQLQGSYPVISISFSDIKGGTYQDTRDGIIATLAETYREHSYLLQGDSLTEAEKQYYNSFEEYSKYPQKENPVTDTTITRALKDLSYFLKRQYGKKVFIFLDEYDTPLQEAYTNGYWQELTSLIRGLFNSTFKTNPYLERAILTGITRVSKESIFSDMNNLEVITTTSNKYTTAFGFTETEVLDSLELVGMHSKMEQVKFWYDGFVFGNRADIYNPWSITKFLDSGELKTYWADTSSNKLVSDLIQQGTPQLKMSMEDLLAGKVLETGLDEQVIFEQLPKKKGAIWSLLLAAGYLKIVNWNFDNQTGKYTYYLRITNYETMLMFEEMIENWFSADDTSYSNFKDALLQGDLDYMNQFLSQIALKTFSSFDTGKQPSEHAEPERFYHGFVLGLIVDLAGRYHITSNRESGFGRYDVMMLPQSPSDKAYILEFKVFNPRKEKNLTETVQNALEQIKERNYDMELIANKIPKDRIIHYGFAFRGKEVLIGS